MERRAFNWLLLVLCFSFLVLAIDKLIAGETIYVKEDKATVREGPDETIYPRVDRVYYGDELEVIEVKDDWYKVKVVKSGKSGWIYKGLISKEKPKPKESAGQTLGRLLRGGSGSSTTSTAAASGLRPFDAKNYQGLKGDFKSVGYLEQLTQKITPQDVDNFLKEGGLK